MKAIVVRQPWASLIAHGVKDLACWCPLSAPCHADVLIELANAPATDRSST